jgi:hypothetical protein
VKIERGKIGLRNYTILIVIAEIDIISILIFYVPAKILIRQFLKKTKWIEAFLKKMLEQYEHQTTRSCCRWTKMI